MAHPDTPTRWTLTRISLGLVLVSCLIVASCGTHADPWHEAQPGQKRVLAVTPALYCFAKNVGGEKTAVLCLLSNKGPHHYEPTPADASKAAKADLFLANGIDLDDFVAKIASTSGNRKLEIFKVGDRLEHRDLIHPAHEEDGHEGHDHGPHDPHVWLSPVYAKKLSKFIADKLTALDLANQAVYAANLKSYGDKLDALVAEGKAAFAGKKNRKVVTMHDSMAYFAKTFGIDIAGTIMPKAGLEADPKRIANIVKLCKEQDVRVICFEPQFAKSAAETLQKALKDQKVEVRIVEFDPLETVSPEETLDDDFYIRRMRQNIRNLAEGLP